MEKEELKALIDYHDDLYYNQQQPEISDAEYDALVAQYGELPTVPGIATGLFPKRKHSEPIASLAKVNDEATLRKELARLMPVIIMPKYDGLTVVRYPDAAVTRGDGEIGDDISINFIGKICAATFDQPVRGEAIIKRDDFLALNDLRKREGKEEFKNRRNAAAGILRSKDGNYLEYVSFVVYDIVGSKESALGDLYVLEDISQFRVTDYWHFDDIDEAVDFIMNFNRSNYMYELDGLVIKTTLPNSIERFGRTGHHPKDSFAYKFQAQGAETVLRSVHWTVGRTGKVVPNAIFDPVDILDTTVSNATLHNIAYIDALKLSIGCTIKVVKANDIIPAVVASLNYNPLRKIIAPSVCPECGGLLKLINDQLYCQNARCIQKRIAQTVHAVSKHALDIKGLSEATIEKLYEEGYISCTEDLFNLTRQDIYYLDGFAEKSAEKLHNAIQAARNNEFNRAIVAASIPLVGRTVARQIAETYKDIDELYVDLPSGFASLAQVDGIGSSILEALTKEIHLIESLASSMLSIANSLYKEEDDETEKLDYVICVTGKFEQPRNYYQDMIEKAGAAFVTSVTKKTTHLLAGEKAGSKLKKANELGVPVLGSINELKYLLGVN